MRAAVIVVVASVIVATESDLPSPPGMDSRVFSRLLLLETRLPWKTSVHTSLSTQEPVAPGEMPAGDTVFVVFIDILNLPSFEAIPFAPGQRPVRAPDRPSSST